MSFDVLKNSSSIYWKWFLFLPTHPVHIHSVISVNLFTIQYTCITISPKAGLFFYCHYSFRGCAACRCFIYAVVNLAAFFTAILCQHTIENQITFNASFFYFLYQIHIFFLLPFLSSYYCCFSFFNLIPISESIFFQVHH